MSPKPTKANLKPAHPHAIQEYISFREPNSSWMRAVFSMASNSAAINWVHARRNPILARKSRRIFSALAI